MNNLDFKQANKQTSKQSKIDKISVSINIQIKKSIRDMAKNALLLLHHYWTN